MTVDIVPQKASCVFMSVVIKHYEGIIMHYECLIMHYKCGLHRKCYPGGRVF